MCIRDRSYFKTSDEEKDKQEEQENEEEEENNAIINGPEEVIGSFEYLLGMKIWALTRERYEKLLNQKQEKQMDLETLLKYSAKDLWSLDLDEFVTAYDKFMADDEEARNGEIPGTASKTKNKRKRKTDQDDGEYNPTGKKPKVSKKTTAKKGKEDISGSFERIFLEPKAMTKDKRPTKVKTESQSPPSCSIEIAPKKKSEPTPASIKIEPREEEGISAFSDKFKKLAATFDDSEVTSNIADEPNAKPLAPLIPIESKSEAVNSKVKDKTNESIGGKQQAAPIENEEVPTRGRRKRPCRAAAIPKKSYQDNIILSDSSYDDQELKDESHSDNDFNLDEEDEEY